MLEQELGKVGRRRFIATAGAATALVAGRGLFVPDRADAITYVRRDIGTLTASDPIMVAYRKAIKAMKALPATNPLSWTYQAAIHYTTIMPTHPAWNTCQHGTPWFWSWHRMYLYWFERIIRKMSGDASWALLYWNYTALSERSLPAMFRDTTSDLYTVNRNPSVNGGSPLPASAVGYASAFTLTNFFNAQNSIEGTPHGSVHVSVGGWMGSVPTAAQDPIFYLHHSNIDRLWDLWLAQGGGRHDPTGDASWKSQSFLFENELGQQVHMKGCDVLRAARQLSYSYQGEPRKSTNTPEPHFLLPAERRDLAPGVAAGASHPTGNVVEAPFQIKDVQPKLMTLAASKTQTPLLQLDGVVADSQPGSTGRSTWAARRDGRCDQRVLRRQRRVVRQRDSQRRACRRRVQAGPVRFPAHARAARRAANRRRPTRHQLRAARHPRDEALQAKPRSPVRIGSASIVVEQQPKR